MNILKHTKAEHNDHTDYILSSCHYASFGLTKMFNESYLLHKDSTILPYDSKIKKLIIYLPEDPLILLKTIRQTATLLDDKYMNTSILFICSCPLGWLWETLKSQFNSFIPLQNIRVTSSYSSINKIKKYAENSGFELCPTLYSLVQLDTLVRCKAPVGLKRNEIDSIILSLKGISINEQKSILDIDRKSLYKSNLQGVNKLKCSYPFLAERFPGVKKVRSICYDAVEDNFDKKFIDAVFSMEIKDYYQPIFDGDGVLHGAEILCRWHLDEEVILPSKFLPKLKSSFALLVLTSFMIQQAVYRINECTDALYFSVNIPVCLANDKYLLNILNEACKRLINENDKKRLILEFPEDLCISNDSYVIENIKKIKNNGYKIYLDDCFSDSSVIFPRKIPLLDGFKLDMSIVSSFCSNDHETALIKSIVYFCKITNCVTIAEGVDSVEKYNTLRLLGIDLFQGYLFSKPVSFDTFKKLFNNMSI